MRVAVRAFLIVLSGLVASTGWAGSRPEPGTLLSKTELVRLFAGKTWKWEDGSAYFGRRGFFKASRKLRESAVGKWGTRSQGEICAVGNWTTAYAKNRFSLCWKLLRDGSGRLWISPETEPESWTPFDARSELTAGDTRRDAFEYARIKRRLIDAKPLTSGQVRHLFEKKSWKWENGFAYFGPHGMFRAATADGSRAGGRWYTADGGAICFNAIWWTDGKGRRVEECWLHAVDVRNRLWQTSSDDPEGWYLFDHKSDLVSGRLMYRAEP